MKFRDAIRVAYRGLSRHWVRATLNVLGIVAGVASVIMLIAVAHAVGAASKASVEGLGANIVVVYPGGPSASGVQVGLGTTSSLTNTDVSALQNPANVPDAVQAVPTTGASQNVDAFVGGNVWQTDVIGTTAGFQIARGYSIGAGSFISPAAVSNDLSQVVLGQTVAAKIFPNVNPINQTVEINSNTFTVIGVFAQRGFSGSLNQDDLVVIPITTFWETIPTTSPIQQILVQASSTNTTSAVQTEVTNTLLRTHQISNPALADFQVQTQQDLVASAERLGTVMQWMLGAVAVIALLTGGIGIMSLMLATVGERAYEIGVRRAVGASREDILGQFLIEALLLAVLGGVAGIALGFGGATFVGDVVTDLPAPVVTGLAVLIAAAVALVIGVGAGLYPAVRASLLQPVEAVRRQ